MEAAVLPLAVLPEVDCNSNTLSADLEVKKLQELVRKLERQNEQLRTRTSAPGPAPSLACPLPARFGQLSFCPPGEPLDYFQAHGSLEGGFEPSVLDELELLDLDSVSGSDASDETWLYVVPMARDTPSGAPHPLQWCRQVLDGPKTEVEAARRSLSLQMEQVSRWRSSLCNPSSSSSSSSSSSVPPLNRVTPIPAPPSTKLCSTPQSSERHAPPLSNILHSALHRTLSPVGKDLPPVAERTPTFLPHPPARSHSLRCAALSPQSSLDGDPVVPEDDSISLGYKLQDLTDVQVMARLQEESLRQDLAGSSSVLAGRRSQSFSFQLSAAVGMEEEDEEDDEDYGLLPPPQPRLTRLPHSHTFSSIRDWRRSTSSLCTPPSPPSTLPCPTAGFTCQPQGVAPGSPCTAEPPLGFRPASAEYDSKLRRSMPNLLRAPNMPCVPAASNPCASPSLLRNSQSFDSPVGLARLHSSIPSPGQLHTRVQSVGNFSSLSRTPLKATAYVSPTVKGSASVSLQALSGIPLPSKSAGGAATLATTTAPRSGLPRPASFVGTAGSAPRGKVVQSARSLLTSPKSLSTFGALRDAAWRDGCY